VLLSIRDYVKLAAPEPEVLRILGEESKRNGTHKMTQRQIDQEFWKKTKIIASREFISLAAPHLTS
jgi:hypothetical protein